MDLYMIDARRRAFMSVPLVFVATSKADADAFVAEAEACDLFVLPPRPFAPVGPFMLTAERQYDARNVFRYATRTVLTTKVYRV